LYEYRALSTHSAFLNEQFATRMERKACHQKQDEILPPALIDQFTTSTSKLACFQDQETLACHQDNCISILKLKIF